MSISVLFAMVCRLFHLHARCYGFRTRTIYIQEGLPNNDDLLGHMAPHAWLRSLV